MERQTLRVLLISDSAVDARWILETLQRGEPGMAGDPAVELLTGGNVSEGLRALREQVVDIVLLDLSLPDAPGIGCLRQVRAAAPAIPVVVLAAAGDETLACAAVGAGAQDYLLKPQTSGALFTRTLRYAVERQNLCAALERLSLTDDLTGLYNRRGFSLLADQQLRFAHRTNQDLLFIRLGLPNLGRISGAPQHRAADRALQIMAQVLRETFRHSDIVGRVGADCFAVLAIDAYEGNGDIITASLENAMARHGVGQDTEELATSLEMTRLDPEHIRTVEELLTRPAAPAGPAGAQPPRPRRPTGLPESV